MSAARGQRIAVVGAGGNIGSHLVPHLGRLPGVARVTLIDRDIYEARNLRTQDITHADLGKPKAMVQARRLRRIAPALEVIAAAAPVERLPLGLLRADVILAGLDSRAARQRVNEMAWHLGVPWIDAGVAVVGASRLARVTVYVPGEDRPCLECAWDERDYEALEQVYPCGSADGEPAAPQSYASGSTSGLGALAASLQALVCERVLAGDLADAGSQLVIDAAHRTQFVTTFRRNPRCRRSGDHGEWRIEKLDRAPAELTLGQVLELGMAAGAGAGASDGASSTLAVEGRRFVRKLTCMGCGRVSRRLHAGGTVARRCRRCGQPLAAAGFDLADEVAVGELTRRDLRRRLAAVGVRAGDVITVGGPQGEVHLEIGVIGAADVATREVCDA
jgi:molybdopterin/thiamine biosynthesis adenylyltransferase